MKILLTILVTCFFTTFYGQTVDYKVLLDSAKTLFKSEKGLNQEELDRFDYGKIITILNKVIEINPNNSEARYFLGYTYSRINSRDGRSMIDMNLELLEKSSVQFEYVNKLQPNYTGEIITLDPYSKLSAEWGSMAMSYWHNNKKDSSIWAFKEGKKRGGFGDFMLELNRKVLDACSLNSILVSSGDNFTIPLWYLQIVEGYRKDVSVIDVSLLNTKWYPAYLIENRTVAFDLPKETIDTLDYTSWKDSLISIEDFSWIVKPSYYNEYLLRGDRVFLSLLKENKFNRDLYFTISFMEESRLSLKNYITNYIIVDKFTKSNKLDRIKMDYSKGIEGFLKMSNSLNLNSVDERLFYDYFRFDILEKVNQHVENNEKEKAKELMRLFYKYANEDKIPYVDESGKEYADYVKSRL